MNWKPNLARCVVMSFGMALVGCGSTADTANEASTTSSQQAPTATNAALVTLDLPGMT